MNPIPDFASEARPLRASALPMLLKCPLRAVLLHMNELHEGSGEAADTGSMVHAAVDHWHKHKDDTGAYEFMRTCIDKFPQANIGEAEAYLWPYTQDPRNREAEVIASEMRVTFTLSGEGGDGLIYVRGTLDQIRREDGVLKLWDLKTGKKYSGWEMLHIHAVQQAAYVLGASQAMNTPVYPGGIIRAYGYRVRGVELPSPGGVFYHSPWGLSDCYPLLRGVQKMVQLIRNGGAFPISGDHCNYCPAQGLGKCLPIWEKMGHGETDMQ